MKSFATLLVAVAFLCSPSVGAQVAEPGNSQLIGSKPIENYVAKFNEEDFSHGGQAISNAEAAQWMLENVPRFECPDKDIEEIYHFRWWTYRKHIKETPDGFVITEFLPKVNWSGKHNTISCPAGHHFREGRWIHNRQYLDDYARFWFRGGGAPRHYSFWAANSVLQYCMAKGDLGLAKDLLPDLIANYREWEKQRLSTDGLYWQVDDRDGMEVSIGGKGHSGRGKRPTINSYQYGDARAIAVIAEQKGDHQTAAEFRKKADSIRRVALEKLWDREAEFFKVLPLDGNAPLVDVRELHGYTPWYFHLPTRNEGYEAAWKQLREPKGFEAPYGPTTAEQRHPGFTISYEGHECQWNGPSWPFATSVTLTALANVLHDYPQQVVSKEDYLAVLKTYTKSHRLSRQNGSVIPWIDENLDPFTGKWIARSRLKVWDNGTWSEKKGGIERGKDYNHSSYCDLIISGLVGLRANTGSLLRVEPLVPEGTWEYFCLENVPYHGRSITVVYDRDGTRYRRGKGLRIFVDGAEIAASQSLAPISADLP